MNNSFFFLCFISFFFAPKKKEMKRPLKDVWWVRDLNRHYNYLLTTNTHPNVTEFKENKKLI